MANPSQALSAPPPNEKRDGFGNVVDPVVSFARGRIIGSSVDEVRRLRHGQAVAAERVRRLGPQSIGVFTGNQRDFPIRPEDIATSCEEWVGPGLVAEELRRLAVEHLGGLPDDGCAVFNRTSAGIVATIAAHAGGRPVLSIVPLGGRSHASVVRGCGLARVEMIEVQGDGDWRARIAGCALVVVTTVTSSLERLDDEIARAAIEAAKAAGCVTFLDEAYGARVRPYLHGGAKALELGADLAITNCDKAGLSGPRSGVLAGRAPLVVAASAKGSEYGMEARAPIAAATFRSLAAFDPAHLRKEAESGGRLAEALARRLGGMVARSDLGPMIHEDDVLRELIRRSGLSQNDIAVVPAESGAALGMVLLEDHGILTVNTHGQPGARISVRLKPTLDALDRVGGIEATVEAFDRSVDKVAAMLGDETALRALIHGRQ
ncbi:selenocysteine synthase [Antarcticirhabdus aurantiaca]|uniref:Selenocysteine synthase n=1 Tax=Antarcticirhabdus aurantiaca TaxID=2606717 RepID=A0ACD4NRY5_9HYPH|nr:selenocysteine synthase [Antarcticirhabdus aurantiaca]WAJ29405.1 selenocysteine synthase [Jeongeuplla avenae]